MSSRVEDSLFHRSVAKSHAHIRHLWLGIRRSSVFLVLYIVVFLVYLITGAITFSSLEKPADLRAQHDFRLRVERFRNKYPNIGEEELVDLLNAAISVYSTGGVADLRNSSIESSWNFDQSFFFVVTLVTTIGYGQASPITEGGKIFCILYCIIGIPMNIILTTALVDRLMVPTTTFLQFLGTELGNRFQAFNIRVFHFVFVCFVSIVCFLLLPAAVYSLIEPEWSYLDAVYFCFISLTTIGLGDLVPGESPLHQRGRPLYKITTAIYLLVGLVFVVLMMTVFYGIPQLNVSDVLLLEADDESIRPPGVERKPLLQTRTETETDTQFNPHETVPATSNYGSFYEGTSAPNGKIRSRVISA